MNHQCNKPPAVVAPKDGPNGPSAPETLKRPTGIAVQVSTGHRDVKVELKRTGGGFSLVVDDQKPKGDFVVFGVDRVPETGRYTIALSNSLEVLDFLKKHGYRVQGADFEEYGLNGNPQLIGRVFRDKADIPTHLCFLTGNLARREISAAVNALFD